MPDRLYFTDSDDANALIASDPMALLIGFALDQQVSVQKAFAGPLVIKERLGAIDAATLASTDLEPIFRSKPAIHRYPGSMAGRVQALANAVRDDWDSDAAAIWTQGDPDGPEVLRRLKALPGFGDQKAKIFLALLGKQLGLQASGWREAAGHYGEDGTFASVADIVDGESLTKVRATKQAAKAAAKAAKA